MKPSSELLAGREQAVLRVAVEPRVLALLRDERRACDLARALERLRLVVRRAVGADLALGDELLERADRLLERRVGILFVVLVQLDVVGLQALQRRVERGADVLARAAPLRAVAHRLAELRGEHDLVAASLQHPAEQRLAAALVAVDVRGVEERDARVERGIDDGARRILVDPAAEVVRPEADDGDVELAKLSRAHASTVPIASGAMRHWEDFHAGEVTEIGPVTVSEAEIVEFATPLRPAVLPRRPEAAKDGPYGGLIASGWHTAALFMGMFVRAILLDTASLGSPGIDELRWTAPVRPGDTLHGRVTVDEVRESSKDPAARDGADHERGLQPGRRARDAHPRARVLRAANACLIQTTCQSRVPVTSRDA